MKLVYLWLLTALLATVGRFNVHAEIFELRGTGILPDVGAPPAGVPGEEITVSVMLSSDDFQYVPLSNPIIHYFAPSTTVPVTISGSVSGEYGEVSPIARFVALELENSASAGDSLMLDVTSGTAGTSLLSLSTSGVSGFDGSVTPQNPHDLFSLFADAMDDQGFWTPSSSSAVFVGAKADLLYLGQLQWTLISPLAGDLDTDGDVDGQDFLLWQHDSLASSLADWQDNYGMVSADPQAINLPGDFDQDGQVNGLDYLVWQRDPTLGDLSDWQENYGLTNALSQTLVIPEPGTAILILLSLGVAGNCRSRTLKMRN